MSTVLYSSSCKMSINVRIDSRKDFYVLWCVHSTNRVCFYLVSFVMQLIRTFKRMLSKRNFWNDFSELGILIKVSERFKQKPSFSQNSFPCSKLNIQNSCFDFRTMLLNIPCDSSHLCQKIMVSHLLINCQTDKGGCR